MRCASSSPSRSIDSPRRFASLRAPAEPGLSIEDIASDYHYRGRTSKSGYWRIVTSEFTPAPANEIGFWVVGSLNVANIVEAPVIGSILTTWPVPSWVNPITLFWANDVPNSFG